MDDKDDRMRANDLLKYLLPICLIPIVVGFCWSCSPKIVEKIVTEVRDTTIVEIHERLVHDTVKVEIPVIIENNVTPADSSHLENEYAVSDAYIKDGLLHHSLRTKGGTIEVPVDIPVADTTTTHNHYENHEDIHEKIKEVEKPLSRWKSFKLGAFWWLILSIFGLLGWIFKKPLLNLLKTLL